MKKLATILFMTLYFASNTFAEVGGTVTRSISSTDGVENSIMPISAVTTSEKTEIKKIYKGAAPKIYATKEEFLKGEGKTAKSATDGCNRVMVNNGVLGGMTMMYCEEVYGKNGKETWYATDTELDVGGDAEYVDQVQINALLKHTEALQKVVKKFSKEQLEKGLENAGKQIESVKMSRIARQMQVEKITTLYYLNDIIKQESFTR